MYLQARYITALLCLLSALPIVCGCALGPSEIHHSRLKYNQAVQETFQEEMLLNLVRLKYREIPEFISIGGIAAQYTFEGSTAAGLTLPERGPNIFGLDGGMSRSEKPTISYAPARGEEFQKGLLAPIDLESLQLLARTGWSWERILRTSVQYINGVDNATSAGGPTPDYKPQYEQFRYLSGLLRQLQIQRQVELAQAERETPVKVIPLSREQLDGDFVINAIKEGYSFREMPQGLAIYKKEQYSAIVFHPTAKHSQEMQEVARLLELTIDFNSPSPAIYEVTSADEGYIQTGFHEVNPYPVTQTAHTSGQEQVLPPPRQPTVMQGRTNVVVSTRSLLEVMFYLSQGISIPAEHVEQGLVTVTIDENGCPFDWSDMTGDLLQICSAKHRPKNAAVAVPYKGYWFYIDDRDLNSQSTFTLLVELFGIEVRAGGGGGFLYTLSVGG